MITREEFERLQLISDKLESVRAGRSTTITRMDYELVSPITQKHRNYTGSMLCRYCVNTMMNHAISLYDEYVEAQKKEEEKKDKATKEVKAKAVVKKPVGRPKKSK